jgi:hypothetical protein
VPNDDAEGDGGDALHDRRGVLVAILLTIALGLLIVLEIQWVKYWSVLLKRQRESDVSGSRRS